MREIRVILDESSVHERRTREAVDLANASQRLFFFRLAEERISLESVDREVNGDDAAQQLASTFPNDRLIGITDRPFDDDWYSHEYRHCAVITTCDWERLFAPPSLRTYLVYQMAQALVPIEADISEEILLQLAHDPPIGCLHDLNRNKADIRYGMVGGNMCYVCTGKLRQFGVSEEVLDAVRRILSTVRDEATGTRKLVDPFAAFIVIRFSEHDENANAYRYGVRPGLEDVGLKPLRGNDAVQSSQIFDQIFQSLDHCRFVVAKVDVENLNVYFELGLAMGLDKDVLLVSESELVVTLPSDLSNWEVLTYQKGDYEGLRRKVASFYATNYHLEPRKEA